MKRFFQGIAGWIAFVVGALACIFFFRVLMEAFGALFDAMWEWGG